MYYENGIQVGKSITWFENGQVEQMATFNKNGELDGKNTLWYENGQIEKEAIFKDGECISGDCE